MKDFKSGFVAVIGRPNVGKSTLLNTIIGQKIVIATDKAQTTRRRIKGIFTNEEGQIVFIDTPGIHKPLDKLGEYLMDEAKYSIPDADLILFIVDVSEPAGAGDKWIVENLLKETKTPVIIVLNKVDKLKDPIKKEQNLLTYKMLFDTNLPTAKISAQTGRNIDTLISTIMRKLPEGAPIYAEDDLTDESMRSIAQEIIREKILLNTKDEIPHSVAVLIEKYEEKEDIDKIYAKIHVEHESQKGIMIGKKGQMLKTIGMQARKELEKMLNKKVYLELNVKVSKDWRKKTPDLENWV
ncbi:TPA: GTPase Era [Candidatus Gastranaerophilales bacterium HUM_21]|nr:MAG TPA: GTPase Era [Candidatus Gastranaerophilales bacterium HUM_21]